MNAMNDAVQRRIDIFIKAARVPNDAWERRFAQRFALAFAAGAIAGEFGVAPWDTKTIGWAVKSCYLAARAAVPDADQLRSDGFALLLTHLRNKELILDLMRSGHKVYWTAEQAQAAEIFRRSGPKGVHFLVAPATFQNWFRSALQSNIVLDEVEQRGYLLTDGRKLKTVQTPIFGINRKAYYYCISEGILNAA